MRTQNILGRGLQDVAPAPKPFEVVSLLKPSHQSPPAPLFASLHPETICIASGKGGTGKTFLATNPAVEFVRQGEKVTVT